MQEIAQRNGALEASEGRLHTEAPPDVILTINQRSEIVFINMAAEALLGYKPEELIGRPFSVLMPPTQAHVNRFAVAARKNLNWINTEIPVRHANGRIAPMEFSFGPFKLQDEIFFSGILRDISVGQRAMAQLKRRERHTALRAKISSILATPDVFIQDLLQQVSASIAEQLQAAVVRVWAVADELAAESDQLELQAQAYHQPQTEKASAPASLGAHLIQQVVEERQPYWINEAPQAGEETSNDQAPNLVGFAAFPLLVENGLVGVLAIFSRTAIEQDTFDTLSMVSEVIAQRIERQRVEDALLQAAAELEGRVRDRTAELLVANESMRIEMNERKRVERELSGAQEFLHKVVNSLPNPVFVKDEKGKFSLVNVAFANLYGKPAEELIGKGDTDFHAPEEAEKFIQDDRQVMESQQEKLILEEKHTDYQGTVRWLQTVKRPLILGTDSPRYLLGIATDLTERKALENQLRQAQKLESIGQLAAGIAHEINTPTQYVGDNTRFVRDAFKDIHAVLEKFNALLDSVRGGTVDPALIAEVEAELKLADLEYLGQEIPSAIEQALEGVSRIAKIVQSMKDFAHPGGSEKKMVDLNKAIESTITVARNEWKYIAEMETCFDENLPPVPCLIGEFNQVILNMIVNATHAIAAVIGDGAQGKGKITISTAQIDDDWVEVRVADSGTGIPPEARDRIFDPFFTTKEVGKGTGQGLAISHTVVVEKHGGQLTFETELGRGTTFIIRLPLQQEKLSDAAEGSHHD